LHQNNLSGLLKIHKIIAKGTAAKITRTIIITFMVNSSYTVIKMERASARRIMSRAYKNGRT